MFFEFFLVHLTVKQGFLVPGFDLAPLFLVQVLQEVLETHVLAASSELTQELLRVLGELDVFLLVLSALALRLQQGKELLPRQSHGVVLLLLLILLVLLGIRPGFLASSDGSSFIVQRHYLA